MVRERLRGRHSVAPLAAVLAVLVVQAPTSARWTPAPHPQQPRDAPQESTAAIAEALALAEAGDLAGAIGLAEALCAEDNAPDVAFGLLGSLHVEAANFERAMEILRPLAARDAADPGVLYNAGRAAEGLALLQDAATFYGRSLETQPLSPALRALGMMLGRSGRPEDAYVFLQPWTAANPDDHEARRAAAAGAIALERAPEAEALLEGLPADEPGVKVLRAQVHMQRADPWGAINELRLLAAEPPPAFQGAIRRTLAKAYLVVGEAEGALEQMELIEDTGPEDAVVLASAYFQAGRLDEALDTLAPFAEPLPNSPRPDNPPPVARDIVLEYGRYLHSAGEAARAVPFLRLATELDANSPDAFQALGQALAARGDREEAREVLERFQDLSRRAADDVASVNEKRRDIADPTGRELRAALDLAAAGELDRALENLARESQLSPNDPRPAYAASSLLLDAGRYEEALVAADRALTVAPERADGLYQRGAVLMSLARLADAEQMFRQALDTQATHTAALSDYAVLLMSEGRNDEAIGLLERLLELRPDDPMARDHLSRLRGERTPASGEPVNWVETGRQALQNQDFQTAEESLRRAVQADSENAALRLDLASALWENNKPAEAEQHAREAVTLEPAAAAAHRLLGGLLLWRGEYLRAAESLERAADLAEPGPALLLDLGRAWEGAGNEAPEPADEKSRLARAEEAYRRAVNLAPEHSEAAYGLGQVLRRLGRDEEARAQMERYRELYAEEQRVAREGGNAATDEPPNGG
ncbi:MAG: tetratricopeptide repeat protein [Holophagales bacterium]|nr:tetratricopeptide repeat protein [Holophagales bacterium]